MNLRPLFAAAALLAASGVSADVTEELNFSYPINEGGRISVDNVNGDVTVIGGSGAMVEITAIKRAGSQAYLDGLQITIRNTDDAIRIETDHPERSGMSYTVRVPAHVNLDAIESVNGDLNISGVSGIVRASTVNGSINAADLISDAGIDTVNGAVEVSFARFGGAQKADCETVNGRLTINLPGDADARVQAETINGGIDASDFGLATNKGFVGRDLEGAIGAGSARLELSTVNGAIKVRSH